MSSCVCIILFKSEQICGRCCKMLRGSLFFGTHGITNTRQLKYGLIQSIYADIVGRQCRATCNDNGTQFTVAGRSAVIMCTGRSDSKTRSIEGAARRGNGNSPTVHLWPAEYLIIQRCAAEPRRNGGRSNMRRSVTPLWRASDDRRQCYFSSAVVY